MIILDTNVISELMRPAPDERVGRWIARQPPSSLFTTAITQAEVFYGLSVLPEGRRREARLAAVRPIFEEDLAGRILAFDSDAAVAYASIAARRRQAGSVISQFDAQIAAISQSRGGTLATRNGRDFADCDVAIIDPWA